MVDVGRGSGCGQHRIASSTSRGGAGDRRAIPDRQEVAAGRGEIRIPVGGIAGNREGVSSPFSLRPGTGVRSEFS